MAAVYKKALQSFFLKVHPDFFASHAKFQRVNESSIAQLNELLSWAKDVKSGGVFRPPPSTTIALSFYAQSQLEQSAGGFTEQQESAPLKQRGSATGAVAEPLPEIQAVFELPPNFTPTDTNRTVVERATNKFLRDLLRKAKCIDSSTEAISVAEDVAQQKEEVKPLRRRHKYSQKDKKASKSLLDEAAEAMVESWNITAAPTVEELIEADQIFVARHLSPLQSAMALQTIRTYLGEMMYERWQGMPLVISDKFSVADAPSTSSSSSSAAPHSSAAASPSVEREDPTANPQDEQQAGEGAAVSSISGSFSVPWDFTMPQFYAFLQAHDRVLQERRLSVESFAATIESIVADICNALEVDDILISCSHKDALACLKLLKANAARILRANVTHVTLEIGSRFAMRSNGVVVVPHNMDVNQLTAWLRTVSPRMPQQQKLYVLGKQMLESTMWHLKQFREIVEPAGVDAFENDHTYLERQTWAKELYRISGSLAQWDWTEFTFTMGPVDVNWDKKYLTLPFNFDGAALIRYIESVHEEAKKKKRDQQLAEIAQEREDDERRVLERGTPASLEEELAKEFPAAANSTNDPVTASLLKYQQQGGKKTPPSPSNQWGESSSSSSSVPATTGHDDEAGQRQQRLATKRQELADHMPHMAEYMTSSPNKVDALSVERPLHHSVTFASDDEAKDQLLWEGFYDDAYVDQKPQSDIDDLQHAYFATNRWHREKAAEQMLEELQGKYGKKARRFDHIKMGDLMGINNPKDQPKGFPILAPGTRGTPRQQQ